MNTKAIQQNNIDYDTLGGIYRAFDAIVSLALKYNAEQTNIYTDPTTVDTSKQTISVMLTMAMDNMAWTL